MIKSIKEEFDEIVKFQSENPGQKRSGCLYYQNASGEILYQYEIQDEVLNHCNFYTAKLRSCKFINCTFLECNFMAVQFTNCKFINCVIKGCNFTSAILTDTQFKDCKKTDNILNHLHCSGLTKGLTAKDENIMQDEIVNQDTDTKTAMQQDYKTVFINKITKIMNDNFSKWEIQNLSQQSYPSFTYCDQDKIIGITLYSDEEKNSTDTDNFWCLSVFFKNDIIFTSDFNLFGLESDDIVSIINNWKEEVIKNNASSILERIFENLK